jgi:hypothetical protein
MRRVMAVENDVRLIERKLFMCKVDARSGNPARRK